MPRHQPNELRRELNRRRRRSIVKGAGADCRLPTVIGRYIVDLQKTVGRRFPVVKRASSEGCRPVGAKEVATLLKVKRTTVQQWQFRQVLPERDFTVNGLPAWKEETIMLWARQTGRLPE
jgi:hypothetical protein